MARNKLNFVDSVGRFELLCGKRILSRIHIFIFSYLHERTNEYKHFDQVSQRYFLGRLVLSFR